MRNRIFGAIGVIWGGFILFNHFTSDAPTPSGDAAFRLGQFLGLGLMVLMFGAGLYYLIKGDGGGPRKKKKRKSKSAIRTPT